MRAKWWRLLVGLLGVATAGLQLAACSASPTAVPNAHKSGPHIMVLVMENESYGQIIGNSDASYVNTLADTYLRATNSYAHGHDSLPNYLDMISGHSYTTEGTGHDCTPSDCGPIAGKDIADQLDAAGIGWRAFMGAMPSNCDTSDAGGSGGYGVRHDPFVYFSQGRSGAECANDVPATGLLSVLSSTAGPSYVFYSPTICEDGGGDTGCSTIAAGNSFLSRTIPAIMATTWYRDGGTIILTWDEGATSDTSGSYGDAGGHVLTVVVSAKTKGAAPYSEYIDSSGILRTVEHAYGFSYLGDAVYPGSGSLPLGASRS